MSELNTGLRVSANPNLGAERGERARQEDNGSQKESVLRAWMARRRRTIASAAAVGTLLAGTACATRVSGAPLEVAKAPAAAGSVAPDPKVPFPCTRGGALAPPSPDSKVQAFDTSTFQVQQLFKTTPNDIEQCDAPKFPKEENLTGMLTWAEFRQVSTGNRAVMLVRTTTQDMTPLSPPNSVISERAGSLLLQGKERQFFQYLVKDRNGERGYDGAYTGFYDRDNQTQVSEYMGIMDRAIVPGATANAALYEVELRVFNNPETRNDLTGQFSFNEISGFLGKSIDGGVVLLDH